MSVYRDVPVWYIFVWLFFRKPWVEPGWKTRGEATMKLPQPRFEGKVSLERVIKVRRTVRSFAPDALTLEDLSQLLWAAQGITEDRGFERAAPSGGALYPMDIYAVVGEKRVQGLQAGIYHYEPNGHAVLSFQGSRACPLRATCQ